MEPADILVRATAALRALAVGDAMGRATEHYDPAEIAEVYEDAITEFLEPVRLFDAEEWAAGEVGPPTRMVVALVPDGDAPTIRLYADAPVVDRLPAGVALGLLWPLGWVLSTPSRDAPVACIAAAMGAALDGHPAREVLGFGAQAARAAGDGTLAERIVEAAGIAQASGGRRPGGALREAFPPQGDAGALTPFILGLVYATQSARRAILEAVNQGGHAPEAAGIAGAVCAALAPSTLPGAWGAEVERLNDLDLQATARRYLAFRGRGNPTG